MSTPTISQRFLNGNKMNTNMLIWPLFPQHNPPRRSSPKRSSKKNQLQDWDKGLEQKSRSASPCKQRTPNVWSLSLKILSFTPPSVFRIPRRRYAFKITSWRGIYVFILKSDGSFPLFSFVSLYCWSAIPYPVREISPIPHTSIKLRSEHSQHFHSLVRSLFDSQQDWGIFQIIKPIPLTEPSQSMTSTRELRRSIVVFGNEVHFHPCLTQRIETLEQVLTEIRLSCSRMGPQRGYLSPTGVTFLSLYIRHSVAVGKKDLGKKK